MTTLNAPAHVDHPEVPPGGNPAAPGPGNPAPSAPPAPAAKPLDLSIDTAASSSYEYEYDKTDDPSMDMALAFVGKHGIGPQDPAFVAAKEGNWDMLAAKFASMGDKAKGYEQYLAMAKNADGRARAAHEQRRVKDSAAISEAVGGEANWTVIRDWAADAATPEEKKEVNRALNFGGQTAVAMAERLQRLYEAATGTVVTPKDPGTGRAGGAPAGGGALSRKEYTKEIEKLARTNRGNVEGTPEYAALNARRSAGMRAGI